MTGEELLKALLEFTPEQLKSDVQVQLCNTQSPTDDGDYDNAYYEYDNVVGISFVDHFYDMHWKRVEDRKIRIFGYM